MTVSEQTEKKTFSKSELQSLYKKVREKSEQICKPLEIEDYVVQPIEDVSPPKWHLGHTTWFFEQVLLSQFVLDYKVYHPQYFYLFNSYYISFGERWTRLLRGTISRPTVKEVYSYRKEIDNRMFEFIDQVSDKDWKKVQSLITLGLNHEQQHQELLVTDIKCILATSPLNPVYAPKSKINSADTVPEKFINFEGGLHEIGTDDNNFCYDNEMPRHKTFVQDFRLANRMVTCGEFLEFMEDGGYTDANLWLSDGWDWLDSSGTNQPFFWHKEDNSWFIMTLNGLKELNKNEPVCHISYFEAYAYARWRGKRIPTEAEWEIAAQKSKLDIQSANLLDSGNLHPMPAKDGKDCSLLQMIGDLWEWTSSAYLPYPGYVRVQGPLGEYNGKFMNNQMVLKGGSCATPDDHIRISYRNFFQSEKQWQFTGLRLAADI